MHGCAQSAWLIALVCARTLATSHLAETLSAGEGSVGESGREIVRICGVLLPAPKCCARAPSCCAGLLFESAQAARTDVGLRGEPGTLARHAQLGLDGVEPLELSAGLLTSEIPAFRRGVGRANGESEGAPGRGRLQRT